MPFLCRVVVVGRMPLNLPFFDYTLPPELQPAARIGQLVYVPFRGKQHLAVVIDFPTTAPSRNGKPIPLKPLTEILNNEPAFSVSQVAFLIEMAEFYAVSAGFLFKSSLFDGTKKNKALFQTAIPDTAKVVLEPAKPKLLLYKNETEKRAELKKMLSSSGQNLILVPEVRDIQKTAELLFDNDTENIYLTLSSDTKETEVTKIWFAIWSGKPLTLIATRRALFLPWNNIASIILLEEGNSNYKSWDMAPRFETLDAVFFLSKHQQTPVYLASHTPSVESYFFAKKKLYAFASSEETPFTTEKVELINLKDEQRGGNYSFFADESLACLREGLTKGDVFILTTHRGSVSSVVCRDCGFVPRCPACERPYSYHEDTKELVCHFCATRRPMMLQCENCHGTDLAARGIGTQKVERELRRKLKDILETTNFVRIDSDSNASPLFDTTKSNIIIGTEAALAFIDWTRISCTLLLDPDTLLFIPEYKIAERLWQTIRSVAYTSPAAARILVQTKHPEHEAFRNQMNPERFYVKELQQRKFFGYPPFNFILKLSYGSTQKQLAEQEAKRLFASLTGLTRGQKDCTITSPLATTPGFYKKRYWQVILIKVDYRGYKRVIKELLRHVPDTWKVDPNPQSLLGF